MTKRQRVLRALRVRSECGAIDQTSLRFTSGLVSEANGDYAALSDDELIAAALQVAADRLARGDVLKSPRATREYLGLRLANVEHEVFCGLFLDNRHRVVAFEELFRGTVDGASVHPREVVKRVLAHNAAAVIFAHNHPSGVAEPSNADEMITHRLRDALALIDVRVLDHIVVGGQSVVSMAERGLL